MGKRVIDKADFYLRRGDRKRLGRLLRKRRYAPPLVAWLVFRAVWQYRGMLPWLLDQGAPPDCKLDPGDGTPLMDAAVTGDLEAMRLLLDHGADPNARNGRNELPLGFACSYQQWEAAKLLVERGANVNGIEDEGMTHLDYVRDEEGIRVLRALGGLLYEEVDQHNGMNK